MKRVHDTALSARVELLGAGFAPLHSTNMQIMEWARPGALNDRKVIRRQIVDADERFVIESKEQANAQQAG